ncbi:hypothetical protein ABER60_10725 [Heyndrickxia coagulans]|uniref:hypothetical protein n=1 Tax=Heyndrickxia coagulans TaxID=1398 RepID=UPI003D20561D
MGIIIEIQKPLVDTSAFLLIFPEKPPNRWQAYVVQELFNYSKIAGKCVSQQSEKGLKMGCGGQETEA